MPVIEKLPEFHLNPTEDPRYDPAEVAARFGLPEPLPFEDIREGFRLLYEDFPAFQKLLAERPFEEIRAAFIDYFTHAVAETKLRFLDAGFDEAFYWECAAYYKTWLSEPPQKTAEDFLQAIAWPRRFIMMKMFRLGRLQFEPSELPEDVHVAHRVYPEGLPCLNVHIPPGEPLDLSAVHYSLAAAPGFFEKYFGRRYELFHCESWLLAPELIMLLPPNSNILRFQLNFTIYAQSYKDRQAEERVFGEVRDDIENYPEKTSLQQATKAWLLCGNRVSAGKGIMPLEMPEGEEILPFEPGTSFSCGCGGGA